jgi:serine/threonine protein kinase
MLKKYLEHENLIIEIRKDCKIYDIIKNEYVDRYRKDFIAFAKKIKNTIIFKNDSHIIHYLINNENKTILNILKSHVDSGVITFFDIYDFIRKDLHFNINSNSLENDFKYNGLYSIKGVSGDLYSIDYYLDSGGNSNIFLTRRLNDNKQFVLKYVKKNSKYIKDDPNNIFVKEVETIKKLNHPNIIKIIDHSNLKDNDIKFYFTEFYVNSLHKYLFYRSIETNFQDCNINSKINFMLKIVDALGYIQNQGLAHFDIKADNIFFNDINEPIIADFGCVVNLKNDMILKDVNTKLGNHTNASPEQRNFPYTMFHNLEFSDIYSAGIVFNQLVCGQSFEGMLDKKMYSSVNEYLSYLAWIATTMMTNKPDKRPSFSLVTETLSLFKNIWNRNVDFVRDVNFETSLEINLKHQILVTKPVMNEPFDEYMAKFENPNDVDQEFADLLEKNVINSDGGFDEWVYEDIVLEYKKLFLDENTAIGQIIATPKGNNHTIKNSFCIKSFVVNNNEDEKVLFSKFGDTIFMYLNTSKSNFFHMFNINDILNYYVEGIVEHYFYHHEKDFNKIYHSNNLFFKIIKISGHGSLLCFGDKYNKNLLFFVSGNKVFKLIPPYLELLTK